MMPFFNTARTNSIRTYSKTRRKDICATRAFDKLINDEQSSSSSSNVFVTHGLSSIDIHQRHLESSSFSPSNAGDKRIRSDDDLFSFSSDDDQSSKCKRSRYSTSKEGKRKTIVDVKVKERVSVNKPSKKLIDASLLASSAYMQRKSSVSYADDSEVLEKHNELHSAAANIPKEYLIPDDESKRQQSFKSHHCISSCEKQRQMRLGEDDNLRMHSSIVKEENEQMQEHFGIYEMSSQKGFRNKQTHPIHMPAESNELPYVQVQQVSSDDTPTAGDLCFKSHIVKKDDDETSYCDSISLAHAEKGDVFISDTKCISKARDDKPHEAKERYEDVKDSDIHLSSRGCNDILGNKMKSTRENNLQAKTFVDKLSKLFSGKKSLFHEANECVLPNTHQTKSVTSVGSSIHDVKSHKSMSTRNMLIELENEDITKVLPELRENSSSFSVHFTASSHSDSLAHQRCSALPPSPFAEHNYFHYVENTEIITDDHSYSLLSLSRNLTKKQSMVAVSADCTEKVSQKSDDSITTVGTQPISSYIRKDTCTSHKHSKFSSKQDNNCNLYKDSDVDESCSVLLLSPLQASPSLSASQNKRFSDSITNDRTLHHSRIDDSCYKKTKEVADCKRKRLMDNVMLKKKLTKDIDAKNSVTLDDCGEKLCETLEEKYEAKCLDSCKGALAYDNNESVHSRQPILITDIVEQTLTEPNRDQLHLHSDRSSSDLKNSKGNNETFRESTEDDTVNTDIKDCIHIGNKVTQNCAIRGTCTITNSSYIRAKINKHAVEQRNSTAGWSGDFRNAVNEDKHQPRVIENSKSRNKKMTTVCFSDNHTTEEGSRGTKTNSRPVRHRNHAIVHLRKRIRNCTRTESTEKLKTHIAPDDIFERSGHHYVAELSCATDVLSKRTSDSNAILNTHSSKQRAQEKMATLCEYTQESNVRRLLKSPHKVYSKAKALYNPRQWLHATKDEELSDCAKGQMVKASSAHECYEFSNVDDSSPVLSRVSSLPARLHGNDVVKVRVSREQKTLFAVVRNVKEAHECQEYGEKQEFQDDIDYMLDGLQSSQPLATRCLSTLSLASKCLLPAFRMHLRAHSILMKILDALHDAPDFMLLSLCLCALLFAVSCDRLAIELDDITVRLILRLIDVDCGHYGDIHENTSSAADELERIRLKVFDICKATVHSSKMSHVKLKLCDMTAGYLGMELLLSLASKQTADWFKETLRSHGGLKHIINAACHSIDELVKLCPAAAADTAAAFSSDHLQLYTRSEKCLKVLDNVTYMCTENQSFLLLDSSSMFIEALNSFLSICIRDIAATTEEAVASSQKNFSPDKVNKDSPQFIVSTSLLTLLRLLLNITHESERGCLVIGQQKRLLSKVLNSVILSTSAAAVCNIHQFDLSILGLSLLMNLVEKCDANRKEFIQMMIRFPSQTNTDEEELSALESLGMLFSESFKAARLIEETHDAKMDAAEKQQQQKMKTKGAVTKSAFVLGSAYDSASADVDQSGQWVESESGLQWVAKEEEEEEKEEEEQQKEEEKEEEEEKDEEKEEMEEELCREKLGTSSKQLESEETPSSSQDDTDNYTRDLHTAGKHMEDSFVAAYTAVLIGSIIQHDMHLIETVRKTLPELSFNPLLRMIRKFLGFMNFTNLTSASGSKTFHDVLNILESCVSRTTQSSPHPLPLTTTD